MDSLAKKNDRTRCLFFSSGGIRFVSWPPNREGKSKKDAWFKENQQQLMNLENMNTFAQVYNLQVIAGLGVGGEINWYVWRHWIKILGHDLIWFLWFCHTRLHLEFSAKLRIWQVPTCKMEPRSGIIIWQNLLLPAPEPARTDPPTAKLFLSMLCGVPIPILTPINKVCVPIFSKKTLGFLPSLGRSPTNPRMVTYQKEI